MFLYKRVDNVGARGALALPDFQCVNMYKALKHLKKEKLQNNTTYGDVTRDSLLIILSKYMNSTTITLNEFIHMCERKGCNPRKWAWPNIFSRRALRATYFRPPTF